MVRLRQCLKLASTFFELHSICFEGNYVTEKITQQEVNTDLIGKLGPVARLVSIVDEVLDMVLSKEIPDTSH